jgi:hypothetical protein
MRKNWAGIDSSDLRMILENRIGGPGQYSGGVTEKGPLYLPVFESARVAIRFKGNRVSEILPASHFDEVQWKAVSADLDALGATAPDSFGRDFAFSSYRVTGWWHGEKSRVSILPPPDGAPTMPYEMGEHPFVLEAPLVNDRDYSVANFRRRREVRRMALLLNILLVGRVNVEPRQTRHAWAITAPQFSIPGQQIDIMQVGPTETHRVEWVQRGYITYLDTQIVQVPSLPVGEPLGTLNRDEYSKIRGIDGKPLRVPADLDDFICAYQGLSRYHREHLDRALFWFDLASEQWTTSMSASYASLVSAIETLVGRGTVHHAFCKLCGEERTHDVPSLSEMFKHFLDRYAPSEAEDRLRKKMYGLRSEILHGSKLIAFDEDLAIGWDPPWENQTRLHGELWLITRIALRSYLKNPMESSAPEALSYWGRLLHWFKLFPPIRQED